jgi:hypothetical protein
MWRINMIKKKLVWPGGKLIQGKNAKWIYKAMRKAKKKKDIMACMYDLLGVLTIIESRLYELKDYVGEKREL